MSRMEHGLEHDKESRRPGIVSHCPHAYALCCQKGGFCPNSPRLVHAACCRYS